jgi:hypothetical protein
MPSTSPAGLTDGFSGLAGGRLPPVSKSPPTDSLRALKGIPEWGLGMVLRATMAAAPDRGSTRQIANCPRGRLTLGQRHPAGPAHVAVLANDAPNQSPVIRSSPLSHPGLLQQLCRELARL